MSGNTMNAVVLAAGASSRMRYPKALLAASGVPIVRMHVEALFPVVGEIVVVGGWAAGGVMEVLRSGGPRPEKIHFAENPHFLRTTPIDSIRIGLRVLALAPTIIVSVDHPPADRLILRALVDRGAPAVPVFRGRRGHPVLLDEGLVLRILRAPPPGGLREILADAAEMEVDDPQILVNMNRPRDWARWLLWRNAASEAVTG